MKALKFKPGIISDDTSYSNEGGFVDGDKVRFRFGFPEKFGGWEKYSPNQYLGSARRLHNWVALDGSDFMGVGTHLKYYIEEGQTFNDITPIRSTVTTNVTFTTNTTSGTESIVIVSWLIKLFILRLIYSNNNTLLNNKITSYNRTIKVYSIFST